MKIQKLKIIEQREIAKDVFLCVLQGDLIQEIAAPGQFIQIKIVDSFLRRPISISHYDKTTNQLTFIYKVLGTGTARLSRYTVGEYLDCLGPLGNGFDIERIATAETIIISGGGIGVPPLYGLLQALKTKYPDKKYHTVLGFRSKEDVFYEKEFEELSRCVITTDDGSYGVKGNILQPLSEIPTIDYIFGCGPLGLLQAVEQQFPTIEQQLSHEERMACGVGICMGCIQPADNEKGYVRLCKEGPVVTVH